MKKSFDEYQLLEGSHGMGGSLWKGKDHLLVIEGKGFIWPFSERYRRIDFKNIQALVMIGSSRWIWLGLLLSLGLLVLGLGSWLSYENGLISLALTLGLAAGGLGLILLVHLMRGRSCRCFVQTAVQVLRLKPLRRESRAKKVLAELEALCREKQGGSAGVESLRAVGGPHGVGSLPVMPQQAAGKPDWTGSGWVRAAGLLMVLWGLVVAGELWVPGGWYLLLDVVLAMGTFVMTTIGLARVMRTAAPGGLKTTMWISLVVQVLIGILIYALFIAAGVMAEMNVEEREAYSGGMMVRRMADFSAEQAGPFVYVGLGLGLVLVVLGIMMVRGGWREKTPSITNMVGAGMAPPIMPGAEDKPVVKAEIPLQKSGEEG